MIITGDRILKVFRRLEVYTTHTSHHIRGWMVVNGQKIYPPLHVSRGNLPLTSGVLQRLRKSLHLSVPEFEKLVSMKMSRNEYIEILKNKKIIDESSIRSKNISKSYESLDEKVIEEEDDFNPSCFISYSAIDEAFADKINTDLIEAGIDSWFAPHDLDIGEDIQKSIEKEIDKRLIVVLILSKHSIDSEWVEVEVKKALSLENKYNKTVLYPIRIDDSVFSPGSGWYKSIRRRNIGDFRSWQDESKYISEFARLLKTLKKKSGSHIDNLKIGKDRNIFLFVEDRTLSIIEQLDITRSLGYNPITVSSAIDLASILDTKINRISLIIVDVMLIAIPDLEDIGIEGSDTSGGYDAGWVIVDRYLRPKVPTNTRISNIPIIMQSARPLSNEDAQRLNEIRERYDSEIIYLTKNGYSEGQTFIDIVQGLI